jgi:putative membrane-bound dehydrogenase-like protein
LGLTAFVAAQDASPGAKPPVPSSQPLSPAEALAKFQLAEPNLKIELAAAEPDVVDPVAIRFDEQGRMWVAEMRDYPLGPPDGGQPLSRIRVLTADSEGRFGNPVVFAENLPFVTGLQPWRGGVIVTLAGRVAWMKDTNGDGRADIDETWYTGFAEQNSQLRANHPRLALDNHVYVANGLRGGVVVNKRLPDEKPIELRGRDFRFDPLTGKAEAVSGNGQFGLCFDDWGNRFTCSNRNPVIHVVLEDRYLKLAPKIPIPAVVQDVAAAGEKSRIFAISRAWTTSNLHAGQFTAACGVHVYRGDTLRDVLGTNSVFTCDPTGNLVHLEKMKPDGPSFTSTPAYEGKEFLASPDEWFRPVSLETGPDGCLYIVDMYRCVIEHPDFVPDELKKRPDQRLGDDRGRIWRIVPKIDADVPGEPRRAPERVQVRLTEAWRKAMIWRHGFGVESPKPQELVPALQEQNSWARETAHRLLLEQATPEVVDALREISTENLSKEPQLHAHRLWLLHGPGKLDAKTIAECLGCSDSNVRTQAMIVAEAMLRDGKLDPHRAVTQTGEKEREQFQRLLLELVGQPDSLNHEIEAKHLPAPSGSPWMRAALLLRYHNDLLGLFRATAKSEQAAYAPLQVELARLIGSTGESRDALILLKATGQFSEEQQIALVDSLARGLQSRGQALHASLQELKRLEGSDLASFYTKLSFGLLADEARPLEVRLAAARLLGFLPDTQAGLLEKQQDNSLAPELQSVLVASLAQRGADSTTQWQALLTSYDSQSLPIKRALIDNSFRRADGPKLLLEQVAAGVIQPAEIDPLRRKQLLESKDAAIKEQAAKLFASLNPANRVQALADYQPVLAMAADATRGKLVFEKNCSTCHKVGDLGVNVAPDISDSRTKTAAQILADVIQPNRAIDSNYIGYQVLLADGTIATGLLAAETSTSITLKQPGGKVLTVARDEIEQLKATGVSLMPDGLEKNIPQQDMADLLSFIKNWRYLDGKTPLSPGKGLGAGD